MICKFSHLLANLQSVPGYQQQYPVPNCPKHADIVCSKMTGNCDIGNNRQCEQTFSFFIDTKLFFVAIKFVWQNNTKEGYFDSSSIAIQKLIDLNVITRNMLVPV